MWLTLRWLEDRVSAFMALLCRLFAVGGDEATGMFTTPSPQIPLQSTPSPSLFPPSIQSQLPLQMQVPMMTTTPAYQSMQPQPIFQSEAGGRNERLTLFGFSAVPERVGTYSPFGGVVNVPLRVVLIAFVQNMLANYNNGVFESCDGDAGEPMGVYGTSTCYQVRISTSDLLSGLTFRSGCLADSLRPPSSALL